MLLYWIFDYLFSSDTPSFIIGSNNEVAYLLFSCFENLDLILTDLGHSIESDNSILVLIFRNFELIYSLIVDSFLWLASSVKTDSLRLLSIKFVRSLLFTDL